MLFLIRPEFFYYSNFRFTIQSDNFTRSPLFKFRNYICSEFRKSWFRIFFKQLE